MANIQEQGGGGGVVVTSLRLPINLHGQLKRQAKADGRSLNNLFVQIVRKELENLQKQHTSPQE